MQRIAKATRLIHRVHRVPGGDLFLHPQDELWACELLRQSDGAGGYTVTSAANGHWNAYYRAFFNGFVTLRSAEFRISQSLLGGQVIGLGLGQQWVTAVDDNRLWPALAADNSPATWSVLPGYAREFLRSAWDPPAAPPCYWSRNNREQSR